MKTYKLKFIYLAVSSLLILSISGCSMSASGPLFKQEMFEEDGLETLYIYRPDVFCGGFGSYDVIIDSQKVAVLKSNGYTWIRMKPGTHKVSLASSVIALKETYVVLFEIKPEKEHYLRAYCTAKTSGMTNTVTTIIQMVQEETALKELSTKRYEPPMAQE